MLIFKFLFSFLCRKVFLEYDDEVYLRTEYYGFYQKNPKIIKVLARLHENLTDTTDKINKCASLQVMFNVATTFAFSILSFYSLYHAFIASSSELDKLSIVHIVWTMYYIVYDTIIITVGSSTAKEVCTRIFFSLTFVLNLFQ